MSGTGLVSVILPTFNRLRYLPDAVASIFAQTFQHWELLIADDGSDLPTRAYLSSLEDPPRVRVIQLSHSGRPAVVRNAALREAKGEYIAFMDSDDVWMPDKLQIQIGSLRARSACGWSYTGFSLVDDSGKPRPAVPDAQRGAFAGRILDALLTEEALVVTPSVLVRRELITRAGGFNPALLAGEDYDLWVRLAALGEVDFIDQPLVLVRRHREHSFDDITCLENLLRVVDLIQRSAVAPHMNAVLNRRRATIAANLARAHALCKHRGGVVRTLSASLRRSWRYGAWWKGAFEASVRAFAPMFALRAARHHRRRARAGLAPRA